MANLFSMERIMGFCEKVCYFFAVNFMFVVSNLPVLAFLLFVGVSEVRTYLPIFLLCMVFMAPALSAVFYSMNRLIRGIETGGIRDYVHGYKSDFGQKMKLGAGHMLVILILWTNIEFSALQIKNLPLTVLFGILAALAVLVTPNLYMLISRYEMKNMQIVRTACTLLIARPVATLGNIVALGTVLMAYELCAGTTVLFMGSLYGFLVMFMNQKIMIDLESR